MSLQFVHTSYILNNSVRKWLTVAKELESNHINEADEWNKNEYRSYSKMNFS